MRILIIEDEQQIAESLKAGLEAEAFAVDLAEDGERGSYLARTNDYDIIILTVLLSKKSGLDVCKEIRKSGKTTPIIVLSVQTDVAQKTELLDAGADDYVTKPYSFSEVLARIHALLRRGECLENEVLTIDDLTLDTRTHKVFRGDKEIHLTRKEYMLLEYLLKNKGAVLTHALIMEHVWDMNADPFSRTVEAHIGTLRRKICGDRDIKLIQTVHGSGYKIDADERKICKKRQGRAGKKGKN